MVIAPSKSKILYGIPDEMFFIMAFLGEMTGVFVLLMLVYLLLTFQVRFIEDAIYNASNATMISLLFGGWLKFGKEKAQFESRFAFLDNWARDYWLRVDNYAYIALAIVVLSALDYFVQT